MPRDSIRWRRSSLVFLASAGLSGALFINFCALVYQCGCRSLWAGAAVACNVHMAGAKHCPWCAQDATLAYLSILVPQTAISFWPLNCNWPVQLALAIAAFPLFGGLAAAVYGISTGYWG
jgi:hypothetical protein